MKTIMVVYSDSKLSKKEAQTMKRYSFNTSSKVAIGDLLESDLYDTNMQVVDILSTTFKYVNIHTGDLSNKKENSTKQYEIRVLKLDNTKEQDVIVCSRVE